MFSVRLAYLYLLFFQALFLPMGLTAVPIVGYGSSDIVLGASDQEVFYTGFELGLRAFLTQSMPKDFLQIKNNQDHSPLGAAKAAKHLLDQGVSLLTGFPTSSEALMAAEVALKANTLILFSAAGHSRLSQMGPTVYTCAESPQELTSRYLNFALKRFSGKRGLLVSNPNNSYSRDTERIIRNMANDNPAYQKVKLTPLKIDTGKMPLSDYATEVLLKGNYDYILLTMYPDESVPFLQLLDGQKKQVPLLSITWTTAEIELLRRYLMRRRAPIYSTTTWIRGSRESSDFEKRVKSSYGKEATLELAYGYDLGVVTGQLLSRTKPPYSAAAINKAFQANRCFENTSAGRLCFGPNGGHSNRKIYFVEFRPQSGFVFLKQ